MRRAKAPKLWKWRTRRACAESRGKSCAGDAEHCWAENPSVHALFQVWLQPRHDRRAFQEWRLLEQRTVPLNVILGHAGGGEALLEPLSDRWPVTPGSMISGTEPQRKASTGVPQAMASIMLPQVLALAAPKRN